MTIEKMFQLITRDGIKSELKPLVDERRHLENPLRFRTSSFSSYSGGIENGEMRRHEPVSRRYNLSKVRYLQIFEYEEE